MVVVHDVASNLPLATSSCSGATRSFRQAPAAARKARSAAPVTTATTSSWPKVSRPSAYAAGTVSSAAQRSRSVATITGRLRRNSIHGPSGTARSAPTSPPAAASRDTCAGPASSARIATRGNASKASRVPKALTANAAHSSAKGRPSERFRDRFGDFPPAMPVLHFSHATIAEFRGAEPPAPSPARTGTSPVTSLTGPRRRSGPRRSSGPHRPPDRAVLRIAPPSRAVFRAVHAEPYSEPFFWSVPRAASLGPPAPRTRPPSLAPRTVPADGRASAERQQGAQAGRVRDSTGRRADRESLPRDPHRHRTVPMPRRLCCVPRQCRTRVRTSASDVRPVDRHRWNGGTDVVA
ncbi:hypothetical protein STAL104432_06185 [Streptomyces albus]